MPYTQLFFYTKTVSHTHTLSHSHTDAYTQTHLHTQMFLQTISPTIPFTRRCFYTQTLWHTQRFHTQTLLRAYPFTHKHFYTNAFTHRTLYTHTHPFHTHKHVYLAMLPMECHFEPLFGWVMLLQPKKECHGISACGEAISVFIFPASFQNEYTVHEQVSDRPDWLVLCDLMPACS